MSSHRTYNERANSLLVTNSSIFRGHVQSIQSLVHQELDMQMDEWNIKLYGGLQYDSESPEGPPDCNGEIPGQNYYFYGH